MGILRLLTVPIGNIDDITLRVLNSLKNEQYFFVEDTRSFYNLLKHLDIKRDGIFVDSFHDQSIDKVDKIMSMLDKDLTINLVSEAGSPIISDPAFPVLKKAIECDHQIESFPGVSSVIVSLELAGVPVNPFKFHGFFARKKNDIISACEIISNEKGTSVFFESPHRIVQTLKILKENLGPTTSIAVCRELTKKFETVYRFILEDLDSFIDKYTGKGEIVICIYNKDFGSSIQTNSKTDQLANLCLDNYSTKNVSKLISSITGLPTKDCYQKLSQDTKHS